MPPTLLLQMGFLEIHWNKSLCFTIEGCRLHYHLKTPLLGVDGVMVESLNVNERLCVSFWVLDHREARLFSSLGGRNSTILVCCQEIILD